MIIIHRTEQLLSFCELSQSMVHIDFVVESAVVLCAVDFFDISSRLICSEIGFSFPVRFFVEVKLKVICDI